MTATISAIKSAPRNKQSPIKLPLGCELVAIAYGDPQREDHVSIVLGRSPDGEQYVTWIANHSVKTQTGETACGNGHYFDIRMYAKPDELAKAAWEDFSERAKHTVRWIAPLMVK